MKVKSKVNVEIDFQKIHSKLKQDFQKPQPLDSKELDTCYQAIKKLEQIAQHRKQGILQSATNLSPPQIKSLQKDQRPQSPNLQIQYQYGSNKSPPQRDRQLDKGEQFSPADLTVGQLISEESEVNDSKQNEAKLQKKLSNVLPQTVDKKGLDQLGKVEENWQLQNQDECRPQQQLKFQQDTFIINSVKKSPQLQQIVNQIEKAESGQIRGSDTSAGGTGTRPGFGVAPTISNVSSLEKDCTQTSENDYSMKAYNSSPAISQERLSNVSQKQNRPHKNDIYQLKMKINECKLSSDSFSSCSSSSQSQSQRSYNMSFKRLIPGHTDNEEEEEAEEHRVRNSLVTYKSFKLRNQADKNRIKIYSPRNKSTYKLNSPIQGLKTNRLRKQLSLRLSPTLQQEKKTEMIQKGRSPKTNLVQSLRKNATRNMSQHCVTKRNLSPLSKRDLSHFEFHLESLRGSSSGTKSLTKIDHSETNVSLNETIPERRGSPSLISTEKTKHNQITTGQSQVCGGSMSDYKIARFREMPEKCLRLSVYKDLTIRIFQSLYIIQQTAEIPPIKPQNLIPFKFKKPNFTKLLIFDLDETLIHTKRDQDEIQDAQLTFLYGDDYQNRSVDEQVTMSPPDEDCEPFLSGFFVRPYLTECLKAVNKEFEVAVFTAGYDWYANPILDRIDPTGTLIQHRYFRQHTRTVPYEGQHIIVKDLSLFKGLDLSKVLIVDDQVFSFAKHLSNGIPIVDFLGQKDDQELLKVMKYVLSLNEMLPIEISQNQNQQLNQSQHSAAQYQQPYVPTLVSLNERNFSLQNIIKAPLLDFIEHYQVEEMSDSTYRDFDENGDSICSNMGSSDQKELICLDESLSRHFTLPLSSKESAENSKEYNQECDTIGSGLLTVKRQKQIQTSQRRQKKQNENLCAGIQQQTQQQHLLTLPRNAQNNGDQTPKSMITNVQGSSGGSSNVNSNKGWENSSVSGEIGGTNVIIERQEWEEMTPTLPNQMFTFNKRQESSAFVEGPKFEQDMMPLRLTNLEIQKTKNQNIVNTVNQSPPQDLKSVVQIVDQRSKNRTRREIYEQNHKRITSHESPQKINQAVIESNQAYESPDGRNRNQDGANCSSPLRKIKSQIAPSAYFKVVQATENAIQRQINESSLGWQSSQMNSPKFVNKTRSGGDSISRLSSGVLNPFSQDSCGPPSSHTLLLSKNSVANQHQVKATAAIHTNQNEEINRQNNKCPLPVFPKKQNSAIKKKVTQQITDLSRVSSQPLNNAKQTLAKDNQTIGENVAQSKETSNFIRLQKIQFDVLPSVEQDSTSSKVINVQNVELVSPEKVQDAHYFDSSFGNENSPIHVAKFVNNENERRDHSRESQKVGETRQEDSLEQIIFQDKMSKQILTSQKKKPVKRCQTNEQLNVVANAQQQTLNASSSIPSASILSNQNSTSLLKRKTEMPMGGSASGANSLGAHSCFRSSYVGGVQGQGPAMSAQSQTTNSLQNSLIKPPNWTVRKQNLMQRENMTKAPRCAGGNISKHLDDLKRAFNPQQTGRRNSKTSLLAQLCAENPNNKRFLTPHSLSSISNTGGGNSESETKRNRLVGKGKVKSRKTDTKLTVETSNSPSKANDIPHNKPLKARLSDSKLRVCQSHDQSKIESLLFKMQSVRQEEETPPTATFKNMTINETEDSEFDNKLTPGQSKDMSSNNHMSGRLVLTKQTSSDQQKKSSPQHRHSSKKTLVHQKSEVASPNAKRARNCLVTNHFCYIEEDSKEVETRKGDQSIKEMMRNDKVTIFDESQIGKESLRKSAVNKDQPLNKY